MKYEIPRLPPKNRREFFVSYLINKNREIDKQRPGIIQAENRKQGGERLNTISVLFTQNHGWFARFLKTMFGQTYNHVSLSLEHGGGEFYSFNFKGFVRETFEKFRRHKVQGSMLYELQVTDSAYAEMRERLERAKRQCGELKYAFLGIFLCCLGIPFHWGKRYFCSEFVTELLTASQALSLEKRSAAYLPEQLRLELDRGVWSRRLVNVV